MATNVDIASIIHLPIAERLRLIEDIWDSVIREPEKVPVPEWHREELQRRLKAYESKPKEGASWPEVHRRIKENKRSRRRQFCLWPLLQWLRH